MTLWRLLWRSVAYHRKTNAVVLLGGAVGTAVLTGALLVGDSLRGSLRAHALERLGWVDHALTAPRFVRQELANALPATHTAPAILLQGAASRPNAAPGKPPARVGRVTILGVDSAFWNSEPLSRAEQEFWSGQAGEVVLNQTLATALGAGPGETIRLSVRKASAVPRESLLGRRDASDVVDALDVRIHEIVPDEGLGGFRLQASVDPVRNAFVPLGLLQRRLKQPGKVNAILAQGADTEVLRRALAEKQSLDDWGVLVQDPESRSQALFAALDRNHDGKLSRNEWERHMATELAGQMDRDHDGVLTEGEVRAFFQSRLGYLSLESKQLLLEPAVVQAALGAADELHWRAAPTLVYLANRIAPVGGTGERAGREMEIPYSIVAALDPSLAAPLGPFLPAGVGELKDDEIVLADWKEAPVRPRPGDSVRLVYFHPGEGRLTEEGATFRFKGFVPMVGAAADPYLTPEFPGITDRLDLRQWDPPFPYENQRIKPRDERYWERYRTTPKAYISLGAGQRLWGNRFGQTTSVRLAPPAGTDLARAAERYRRALLAHLDPAKGGLVFEPVRQRALAASTGSQDFSGLFLGFSSFLIVAALLLVGLLFRLHVERRAAEVGTLLATGYRRRLVRWLLLAEGGMVAAVGSVVGLAAAAGYAWLVLGLLRAWWPGTLGSSLLQVHLWESRGITWLGGFVAAWIASLAAIVWAVRILGKTAPSALLAARVAGEDPLRQRRPGRWGAVVALACILSAALLTIAGSRADDPEMKAGSFFSSGGLLLIAGLLLFWRWMVETERTARLGRGAGGVSRLGIRNAARHRARSLLTAGLLAAATFLVVAVQSFHREPARDPARKDAGTGGFRLVGESDVPVYQDLNRPAAWAELNFPPSAEQALAGVSVVELRLRAGDDTSCLNLYQARRPRLLGVPPALVQRGGFAFQSTQAATPEERENPWRLLEGSAGDAIPAFADATTAEWMLHAALGGVIEVPDNQGRPARLRLVGLLAESIFQSEVLVSEANFLRLYPQEEGYRFFLVDAPDERASAAQQTLETGLGPQGLELSDAPGRLAAYLAVENTYLATFQALGGIGLLLGALGMAVVLVRTVVERQAELALFRALGYRRGTLRWLVFVENGFLLVLGIGVGAGAALASVAPYVLGGTGAVPWARLGLLIAGVVVVGLSAGALAVAATLRVPLIPALRRE